MDSRFMLLPLLLLAVASAAPSDVFRPPENPLGLDFNPIIVAIKQMVDLFVPYKFPLHAAQPYVDRPQYIGQHGYRAHLLLDRLS